MVNRGADHDAWSASFYVNSVPSPQCIAFGGCPAWLIAPIKKLTEIWETPDRLVEEGAAMSPTGDLKINLSG